MLSLRNGVIFLTEAVPHGGRGANDAHEDANTNSDAFVESVLFLLIERWLFTGSIFVKLGWCWNIIELIK